MVGILAGCFSTKCCICCGWYTVASGDAGRAGYLLLYILRVLDMLHCLLLVIRCGAGL
ncbi:hypothetical protein JG688_00006961 [Phytophthora aleatoria]|uniref:Uncharacterized protein n=1 Tax=Phytophthora aleatoria TaxID=2496075 RepID=A0A8J5IT02_9STRA|nr:hypothetical protein JG688_00006961 [Phytophthora aleatoria]